MGRSGDCVTCYSRQRAAVEAARAAGASYADLARRFGLAETSLRRHFRDGHAKPRHAPIPVSTPNLVTMEHLRRVAAEFSIPIADMVFHHLHCRKGDIELVSDAEGDEILEMMREHATPEEFDLMFPA